MYGEMDSRGEGSQILGKLKVSKMKEYLNFDWLYLISQSLSRFTCNTSNILKIRETYDNIVLESDSSRLPVCYCCTYCTYKEYNWNQTQCTLNQVMYIKTRDVF